VDVGEKGYERGGDQLWTRDRKKASEPGGILQRAMDEKNATHSEAWKKLTVMTSTLIEKGENEKLKRKVKGEGEDEFTGSHHTFPYR